jgi:hypothetical protein
VRFGLLIGTFLMDANTVVLDMQEAREVEMCARSVISEPCSEMYDAPLPLFAARF